MLPTEKTRQSTDSTKRAGAEFRLGNKRLTIDLQKSFSPDVETV